MLRPHFVLESQEEVDFVEYLREGLGQDGFSHLSSWLSLLTRLHLDQCEDSVDVFRDLFDLY